MGVISTWVTNKVSLTLYMGFVQRSGQSPIYFRTTSTVARTETFPPVLIEIQNTVDKHFVRRLMRYCGHVYDKYRAKPIVLIICINAVRKEVASKLEETSRAPYMKKLPSYSWAQDCFFISEATIASFLDTTPLSPIVALTYVMAKQQVSLLGLEYRGDATVKLLYAIAKKTLHHGVYNEEKRWKYFATFAGTTPCSEHTLISY